MGVQQQQAVSRERELELELERKDLEMRQLREQNAESDRRIAEMARKMEGTFRKMEENKGSPKTSLLQNARNASWAERARIIQAGSSMVPPVDRMSRDTCSTEDKDSTPRSGPSDSSTSKPSPALGPTPPQAPLSQSQQVLAKAHPGTASSAIKGGGKGGVKGHGEKKISKDFTPQSPSSVQQVPKAAAKAAVSAPAKAFAKGNNSPVAKPPSKQVHQQPARSQGQDDKKQGKLAESKKEPSPVQKQKQEPKQQQNKEQIPVKSVRDQAVVRDPSPMRRGNRRVLEEVPVAIVVTPGVGDKVSQRRKQKNSTNVKEPSTPSSTLVSVPAAPISSSPLGDRCPSGDSEVPPGIVRCFLKRFKCCNRRKEPKTENDVAKLLDEYEYIRNLKKVHGVVLSQAQKEWLQWAKHQLKEVRSTGLLS